MHVKKWEQNTFFCFFDTFFLQFHVVPTLTEDTTLKREKQKRELLSTPCAWVVTAVHFRVNFCFLMLSFWDFLIFCSQFVSFVILSHHLVLIISTLRAISRFSRRRSWWLFAQALSLEPQFFRCFRGMK